MASVQTTRGVSFDPAEAAAQRERQQARRARGQVEKERLRLRAQADVSNPKAYAIYLDECEKAWKERARDRRNP